MRYDLYAWLAPRNVGPDEAAALVEPWETEGGDPAESPFEPSTNTGWFARELARDAPGIELHTDSPPWDAKGPIWLQGDDAPPARVVAMRMGPSATRDDLEAVMGLAAKYDLVLYDPRSARVIQPLEALAAHASATFWPRGAIRAGVAGVAGLVLAIGAYALAVPILSGVGVLVGLFLAAMSVLTFVAEGRARRRGGPAA